MIEIVEREPMLLVGWHAKFICITAPNPTGAEVIGNLWRSRFDPELLNGLPGCQGHPTWGVIWGDDPRENPDELNYLAGLPFSKKPELPAGVQAYEVPGGLYAKITHRSPIDSIGDSIGTLLKWIENSEYELAGHDLELYDDRWIKGGPNAEMDYFMRVHRT